MKVIAPPEMPPCPPAGSGVHLWCYRVFNTLIERGRSEAEAAAYCHEHATRALTPGDVPTKANSKTGTGHAPRRRPVLKPRRDYVPSKLESFARRLDGFGAEELWWRSPVRPDNRTPADFLRRLYQPDESVIVFDNWTSQGQVVATIGKPGEPFDAGILDDFRDPPPGAGAWFLCNPVDGRWLYLDRLKSATNPTGRTRRAEENLTAMRYMVLESDAAPAELWLPALAQLPLPIAAIYTSGGRSIHALVRVDAESKEDWTRIKEKLAPALTTLGADYAAITAVRLTRLPGCYRREKVGWQELLFLNPEPAATPIAEMPEREDRAEAAARWRTAR
jgi:hypothetical protein